MDHFRSTADLIPDFLVGFITARVTVFNVEPTKSVSSATYEHALTRFSSTGRGSLDP